jgi:hypothetical protein
MCVEYDAPGCPWLSKWISVYSDLRRGKTVDPCAPVNVVGQSMFEYGSRRWRDAGVSVDAGKWSVVDASSTARTHGWG